MSSSSRGISKFDITGGPNPSFSEESATVYVTQWGRNPLRPASKVPVEKSNSTQEGANICPGISGERKSQMKRYTLHLVSLFSLALAMACLIPQRAAADDDDPPGRVARLGFVRGNVSSEPAGTEDWVSAVINR